jgi:hypothetical protein
MWLLTVSMAHLASRRSGKHFLRNAQRQSDTSRYPFDGTFWRAIYRLPFRVNRAVLPVFRLLPVLTHKRTFSGSACMSQTCQTGLMHRSKLECSAAAWGPFKEFGLVANRSQPELFAGFITVPGAYRYRSGSLSGRSARCGAD